MSGSRLFRARALFSLTSRADPDASSLLAGASVLTSSVFAFLLALTTAYLLGVTVDPICLSEALPFLVITVGFEKPFLLTRAVFTHPAIAPQEATPGKTHPGLLSALNETQPLPDLDAPTNGDVTTDLDSTARLNGHSNEEDFVRALTARLKSEPSLRWAAPTPVPAREVVVAAVERVGVLIVRDYAIEIAVMAVGATSGVSGLREFCQLAALILTFDCAFLFAFYVAILNVMVEVHRIKLMRGMRRPKPSTPPNVDSDVPSMDVPTPTSDTSCSNEVSPERAQSRPLWRRVVKLLLGKVPFEKRKDGRENPVAKLKLLLVRRALSLKRTLP